MGPAWRFLSLLLVIAIASQFAKAEGDDPEEALTPTEHEPSETHESEDIVSEAPSNTVVEQSGPSASGPSGPSGFGFTGVEECDPDMIGFEIVTGFVYSAPSDLLDSLPGTLMLTDCLEACQGNDSCQAVNYETGLCVLFRSHADSYPDSGHKKNLPGQQSSRRKPFIVS
ncbi:hypothetical protein L9F63_000158, partial [Diploptera punctata]